MRREGGSGRSGDLNWAIEPAMKTDPAGRGAAVGGPRDGSVVGGGGGVQE